MPYVNTRKAEELFRHRVLRLLKDKGHLREERIQLLLSLEEKWRSGFSIDDSVRIPAGQQRAIEHVARYRLRAPVSLSRMRWSRDDSEVFYIAKGSHDDPEAPSVPARRIETLEFVARVIAQIPQPRRHLLFYYGRYSHVVRGKRRKSQPHPAAAEETRPHPAEEPTLSPARKAALRRRWADLIRWVYEVDPLLCERCGGQLRVIGFITEPRVIGKILEHLEKRDRHSRAPPPAQPVSVS